MNLPSAFLSPAALSALACVVLVSAEWRGDARLRLVAKPMASAAFIAAALAGGAASGPPFAVWIVVGLVLGAIGDVALLGAGSRAFLIGLGAFLLGHVAYVVAMATALAPTAWPRAAGPLALIPALAAVAALGWLWPHLGKMRVPVVGYVAVIAAMVVGAMAVAHASALPAGRNHLLAGALLFFVSDLAVARDKFVQASRTNKLWGLPTYYAGQLLIAAAAVLVTRTV